MIFIISKDFKPLFEYELTRPIKQLDKQEKKLEKEICDYRELVRVSKRKLFTLICMKLKLKAHHTEYLTKVPSGRVFRDRGLIHIRHKVVRENNNSFISRMQIYHPKILEMANKYIQTNPVTYIPRTCYLLRDCIREAEHLCSHMDDIENYKKNNFKLINVRQVEHTLNSKQKKLAQLQKEKHFYQECLNSGNVRAAIMALKQALSSDIEFFLTNFQSRLKKLKSRLSPRICSLFDFNKKARLIIEPLSDEITANYRFLSTTNILALFEKLQVYLTKFKHNQCVQGNNQQISDLVAEALEALATLSQQYRLVFIAQQTLQETPPSSKEVKMDEVKPSAPALA